ncbi:MAG TPA: DUF4340 domain-containing protein [bacterium]|jgi:hypothetical protein|nr:DUF4340 domain-containing protein [bacterium]
MSAAGGGRGPIVAVALAAALGLVYWGWVVKIKPERAQAAEDAKLLFKGLDAGQTNEILLRKKGSADVLLRKLDGQWLLISPTAAPADTDAVNALVSALATAKRDEVVVDQGADLHDFGLDQPSGEVTFKPLSPGAKPEVLFFGLDSPEGNQAYGLIDGRPEVFLTDMNVKNSVLKDEPELRDRTVWTFDSSSVQAVRSDIGGFSVARDKQGIWQVKTAARHEPGKGNEIDDWLAEMSRLRADSVPSETGKGDFGLRKSQGIHLLFKNGTEMDIIEGRKTGQAPRPGQFGQPGQGVYVQVAGKGPVFQLPGYSVPTIEEKAQALMDLNVFSFETGAVERIEIQRPSGSLTAVKTAGVWAWTPPRPLKPGQKAFDFYAFLSSFANTQLIRRLDAKDAPLTPTASVSFYGDNKVLLEKAVFGARRDGGQVASSFMKNQTVIAPGNLLDPLP